MCWRCAVGAMAAGCCWAHVSMSERAALKRHSARCPRCRRLLTHCAVQPVTHSLCAPACPPHRSDNGGASFLGQVFEAVKGMADSQQWVLVTVPRLHEPHLQLLAEAQGCDLPQLALPSAVPVIFPEGASSALVRKGSFAQPSTANGVHPASRSHAPGRGGGWAQQCVCVALRCLCSLPWSCRRLLSPALPMVLTLPPAAMPRQVGALVLEAFPPRGIVHPMVEKEKTEVGRVLGRCWVGKLSRPRVPCKLSTWLRVCHRGRHIELA